MEYSRPSVIRLPLIGTPPLFEQVFWHGEYSHKVSYVTSHNSNLHYSNLRHSGVFIVNFEHISHLVLMFLLLTLSR